MNLIYNLSTLHYQNRAPAGSEEVEVRFRIAGENAGSHVITLIGYRVHTSLKYSRVGSDQCRVYINANK